MPITRQLHCHQVVYIYYTFILYQFFFWLRAQPPPLSGKIQWTLFDDAHHVVIIHDKFHSFFMAIV